jgi:hypothetical protein
VELEALFMADRAAIGARRMAWVLAASVPLIMLSYFWATLHVGYRLGLEAKAHPEVLGYCSSSAYGYLTGWLQSPGGPNYQAASAMVVGALVTVALMWLKLRFPFWPLHPIAFPLALSYSIDYMLPAILVTWIVKLVLMRYGGLRAYRTALPFFIGLIVGDFTTTVCGLLVLRSVGIHA